MGAYLSAIESAASAGDKKAISDLAMIRSRAKKKRPSVYSASIGGGVVIDEDVEAFLILLDSRIKQSLVGWITSTLQMSADPDLAALFEEMLSARGESFEITMRSVGPAVETFQSLRSALSPRVYTTEAGGGKSVIIPQLNSLPRALQSVFNSINAVDGLAVHDRMIDYLAVEDFREVQKTDAAMELESWKQVILVYLA